MRYETKAVTFEVRSDDVEGKDTIGILNDLGREGWEPWQMFTTSACGAWKLPVGPTGKIWIAVWLKRALPDAPP